VNFVSDDLTRCDVKAEVELLLEIREKNFHELCIRVVLASENLRMSGKSAYKE